MKKILLLAVAILTAIVNTQAQKIVVTDAEGDPIPLITVLTEDGNIIGTTDLNGELADVKGAERILVTHVAYKPQLLTVALLKDGRIKMEDQDYGLQELVVTPKPYLYVETYYRAYAFINDSLRFYQAGIMPNAYDEQKDKIYTGYADYCSGHFCSGSSLIWCSRVRIHNAGKVSKCVAQNFLEGGKAAKKYYTTTVAKGPNRWDVSNAEGLIGHIEREKGTLRMTADGAKAQIYANKVEGKKRLQKIREEKNYEYQFTEIFNSEGNEPCRVEDFVMYSHHWQWDGNKGRMKFIIETYAVDRGYMTKKDFKDKKRELEKKYVAVMPLSKLEEYERNHNIPSLSPTMRQAILNLKKAKKDAKGKK